MVVYNHNETIIKNYLSISYLDEKKIIVQLHDNHLVIEGDDLFVFYYDSNEIRIHGKVRVMEYREMGV